MLLPFPEDEMLGGAPAAESAQPSAPGIIDPRFLEAIALLEEVLRDEPDDQDSAELAKAIASLYRLRGRRQDDEARALGGDPKQMRVLSRSYGARPA